MSDKFQETDYGAWYLAQCQQRCSTLIGGTKRSNVVLAAKDHVRETGHETAVIRTSSIHYRRAALAQPVAEPSTGDAETVYDALTRKAAHTPENDPAGLYDDSWERK